MKEAVQIDMFTVTTLDPPLRDNRDAMEYPFLSLQKGPTKSIEFRTANIALEVNAPEKYGLANIWDWDLIIFAASHLNEAIEAAISLPHGYASSRIIACGSLAAPLVDRITGNWRSRSAAYA